MRIARWTEPDTGLSAAVRRLEQHGWGIVIVSAGCDWYIHRLLWERQINLPVIANPGRLTVGRGLELIRPMDSPYYDQDTGIDKAAVVRTAKPLYQRLAFAGNGRADLAAALLVPPEFRFAKAWLAEQLTALGEPYHPFHTWSEIANRLVI
jgi:2-hydroxy-3-keto-5-methylthiopentenyl-1-phosphate phosphatase